MSELVDKDAFLKQERKWYCENCDRRKGVKNGRKCFVYEIGEVPCRACDVDDVLDDLECFETIDASPWHSMEKPPKEDDWYILGFLSRWRDGNWWIPKFPDYWMLLPEPPKEEE